MPTGADVGPVRRQPTGPLPRATRSRPGTPPARRTAEGGFALMGVLALLATLSFGLLVTLDQASVQRQRDREAQLLFVGEQYRRALASYARLTPVGASPSPLRLEDLLEDRRFPKPVRHLRQLWPDPFTGRADWQLVRVGDRIVGVHSRSTVVPLRQRLPGEAGPVPTDVRRTVADWRFVHVGGLPR